jgi:DNA-binding transcriptional LysR family regulator
MFPHVSTEALVCALVLSEEGTLLRAGIRLYTRHTNAGWEIRTLQKGLGAEPFQRTLRGFELTEQSRCAIREIYESVPKLLERGYLAIGKQKVEFHRVGGTK